MLAHARTLHCLLTRYKTTPTPQGKGNGQGVGIDKGGQDAPSSPPPSSTRTTKGDHHSSTQHVPESRHHPRSRPGHPAHVRTQRSKFHTPHTLALTLAHEGASEGGGSCSNAPLWHQSPRPNRTRTSNGKYPASKRYSSTPTLQQSTCIGTTESGGTLKAQPPVAREKTRGHGGGGGGAR